MADPRLDLFSVMSMLLALAVGPQFAPALAAYIIIFIGAMIGTLPALKAREPSDKQSSALIFVFVLTAWSFGLTFVVSVLIDRYSGIGWQWFLFPVSFGVSAIGDRWMQAPGMVWGLFWGAVGKVVPARAPKGEDQQ